MADHRITDFVDPAAIQSLKSLKDEIESVKNMYVDTARELVKGIHMNVNGLDDLEKLTKLLQDNQKKAADSTEQLTRAVTEQKAAYGRTTAQIAESLQEQNKLDREVRQSKVDHEQVRAVLEKVNGTYDQRLKRLIEVQQEMKNNATALKSLDEQYKRGAITADSYSQRIFAITKSQRELAQEKSSLTSQLKNEEREMNSVQGSYNHLSQELELLKKAYKSLTEEEKQDQFGKDMLAAINQLDTELKHQAEDMGEHQRNVGDYAIALRDGVVVNEDLTRVLSMEAGTIAGCIEQNKALEQAKLNLNTRDASYAETLDKINAKIEDNKRRISDVSAVLSTNAKTVAEAEAQNKHLSEALKMIDVTSAGAKERIKQINEKIAENKKLIESVTPSSEKLVDQMTSLVGINTQFGQSFKGLSEAAKGGNVIEGLGIKVKAFGQTLLGLLTNPWVLAFLGIAGVVAGVKWWYDYNKGLIEASRLTENFTGKTGEAADRVTADMQTLADKMGKGYDETIGAANKLVQQFGISWEEAYEKMKDGIAAGADMSGNMLANIDRFAPALRDAGVSADEFMSILAETRNGIFNEEGIQNIVKAGTRLRSMTKQTEEALDAVGISAKKMQADLEAGNISMLDAVQQVAGKLKELPENSQEAGQIMKNVFGRTAAEGGTLLIQSIADVNTNLEKAKENMGELGRVNEEQMEAQRRLNEMLISVFKMSGTSFETMITQAKTFVTKGIIKIIEGCVNMVNWFIKIYNQSIVVRASFNSWINTFKTIWEVCKFVVNQMVDSFKALGTVIEGVLTLKVDKIVSGYKQALVALKANVTDMVGNIISNTNDAIKDTIKGEIGYLSIGLGADESEEGTVNRNAGSGKGSDGKKGGKKGGKEGTTDKEAEKAAKEEIKRINDLEDAKIRAMEEGHEKEMATIKHNYLKKIREIRGESEEEKEARIALMEAMHIDLMECEEKYQRNLETINLANRLAAAEKGSKEEYNIKLMQLDMQYHSEIDAAEKTGADVILIREKYEKMKLKLAEEYAAYRIKDIQDEAAAESVMADNAYNQELARLKTKYAADLEAAGNNAQERAEITKKYEEQVAKLTEYYAQTSAQTQIRMIEKMLDVENLSAEDRANLEAQLAKSKIELEDAIADAAIASNQRIVDADKEATEKRMKNAEQWLQTASNALNAVNELASTIFEAKIQRIEEEMDANTEAGEKETELVTELVKKKVITEEEGEARKRAAEAQTAKKNEELERKKQQLQHKQAVWDKANSLAQAGIATALAITQALPNIALAAIAGAMGAIQIATILATPIPKYAKGTDYHPGGIAVVGDAGKQEVVSFGGNMYITPDVPTLIDIPKGAVVYPDIESLVTQSVYDMPTITSISEAPNVVVNNDYARLERQMGETNTLIRQLMKQQHAQAYYSNYQEYKQSRL